MQTNLDVAAGLLRNYKMQVDCLSGGHEAIERIRGGSPVYSAIFMDHMMPGMDGIEATEMIRSIGTEYARKIPIIALTANAIQGTENMFLEHGFQAFISKPIDIMELDSVIRKWVRNESIEKSAVPRTTAANISNNHNNKDNAENSVIIITGVDTEKGLSLYGDEMDIYLTTLRSYVSNAMDVLDRIRIVSEESLPDYVINVHGLKGMSASIGAEIIREMALDLEKTGKAGDLQGIRAKNDRFIKDTENILANIKTWLEKHDKENPDK
jgi:CheY-like chemotaxis protein